jgi:hypothetical protein
MHFVAFQCTMDMPPSWSCTRWTSTVATLGERGQTCAEGRSHSSVTRVTDWDGMND